MLSGSVCGGALQVCPQLLAAPWVLDAELERDDQRSCTQLLLFDMLEKNGVRLPASCSQTQTFMEEPAATARTAAAA